MTDQILVCENCHKEFVFSGNAPAPTLCIICRTLKAQEQRIPPKPEFPRLRRRG